MRIFLNIWFWIIFVIALFIFAQVFWISWLWFWTVKQNIRISDYYIRKYIVDNTPIYTIAINIKLAENKIIEDELIKGIIYTIKDARYYIKSNIIEILSDSVNKAEVLESYLKMMNYTLERIDFYKKQLDFLISDYNQKYTSCSKAKIEWDNEFFAGLSNLDPEKVSSGLTKSAENWACKEKYRIYLSAYTRLYQYLDYVGNLLKLKYDLLFSNTDLILSNLSIFQMQNLNYLLDLKRRLDSFSQISNNVF